MDVVATAGHVDHGKSALVRALTGMEPDRYAEEQRRGMTIDLGFVWGDLSGGRTVAFVDVPGHERFVPTMLAGVGPVPTVLLVVAADGGWMPQTAEHVDALLALGVRRGVLAVTRSDLADPRRTLVQARERLAGTTLADVPAVAVSAVTGAGLDDLRTALDRTLRALPAPDPLAPVRLWVDRSFTVRGSGTVVTGTLAAGGIGAGDTLELVDGRRVSVRGVQSLGRSAARVEAVARVAVNLRGVEKDDVRRGDALLTPGAWGRTDVVDVHLPGAADAPATAVAHVGSAAVPVRVRPLGADAARLTLVRALPLRARDVVLVRDPGRHAVLGGAVVLDTDPPPLHRRGAAAARATALTSLAERAPDAAQVLAARGVVRRADLLAVGAQPPPGAVEAGAWLVDRAAAGRLRDGVAALLAEHATAAPLEAGPRTADVLARLGLPDEAVLRAVLPERTAVRDGRVRSAERDTAVPAAVAAAVAVLADDLRATPFAAPDADRLRGLGLGPRELAAAERAGLLVRVADGVVLLPDAPRRAVAVLAALPQPFTVSQARQALGSSRRVVLPLLDRLDRLRVTRREPDDRRTVVVSPR